MLPWASYQIRGMVSRVGLISMQAGILFPETFSGFHACSSHTVYTRLPHPLGEDWLHVQFLAVGFPSLCNHNPQLAPVWWTVLWPPREQVGPHCLRLNRNYYFYQVITVHTLMDCKYADTIATCNIHHLWL